MKNIIHENFIQRIIFQTNFNVFEMVWVSF